MTTHIDDLGNESRQLILEIIKDLEMVVAEKKDLEAAESELKEKLIDEFTKAGLDYVESDTSVIRYNAQKISKKLNTKSIQNDYPEICEQYMYDSTTKAFVSIKLL